MAQNNKTVHVVELRGDLSSLEGSLSTLRQDLAGLKLPKGIDDSFGKLSKVIQTLQHRVADGFVSPEEFKNVEKEVQQVIKQFGTLAGSLTSLQNLSKSQKLALLPDDARDRLKGATDALSSYGETLSAIIKLEKERTAAQSRVGTATARVSAAQTNDEKAKKEVERLQTQLEEYEKLTKAIKEREAAERAYTEAEKELEKARRSGAGEKAIKSREEKRSKAEQEKKRTETAVTAIQTELGEKKVDEYTKAIEALTAAIKKQKAAKAELEDATKAETAAQSALETVQTQLKQATASGTENAKEQKKAYDTLVAAIKKIKPGFEDVAEEGETMTDKMDRLRQVVEDLSDDELEKLKPALEGAGEGAKKAQKGVDSLGISLDKAKEETKEFNEETEKVKALKDRIKQFLGIAGAVEVFRRAARDAISTITELDKTMTEMAVVTDLTVGDYWNQLPEYSKQASELGVSINSAYKAATLYYQQGLKGNEVTKISAETLKMAKIAGLDTADATDKMTAALRGFNMELNETSAQKIADVYSELAAITAADVDEISSAMTKTASIASSAGMEFETTAAFLSQIIETTRESAETAGTAMKTVIARFQELKKAPEDMGEVDGEIVDANAIETALRSVGVSLRDASGQFRELDDVFLELSSKWDGLDKNTQRYIATIAAGSRQQSRFIAMMQNYGRTQELVNAANNSAGASQRQFEKTTESLESKVERLKNSWHEFTMGIMNSEFVKFGVDILNTFMEIVNKATSSLDGIWGSLSKIASVLAIFQMGKKIFQKLTPVIDKTMLGIVKKFYGYGEGAAKEFKKGVEGEKKKREDMTPEEREEDDRQRRLETTRGRIMAEARGEQATIGKTIGGAKEAIVARLKRPAERRERVSLNEERAKLSGEAGTISGNKIKVSGQIEALQAERKKVLESSRGSARIKEIDKQITQKQAQLRQFEARLAEINGRLPEIDARMEELPTERPKKSVGEVVSSAWTKTKSVVGGATKEFFATDEFGKAKKAREQALAAGQRLGSLQKPNEEEFEALQASHSRYTELRGEGGETVKKRRKAIQSLQEKRKSGLSQEEVKQLQLLEKEEEEYKNIIAREKEYQKAKKGREEYMAAEEDFNVKTAEFQKQHEAAWQSVGDNIGKAGEKVIGVGVAMSTLGGIFSQLGLEGIGETFATIGQFATLAGTAMTALGPIIAMIGKIGVTEAGKLTIAGYTTQLAWWWIALIVTAVVALAVGVALLFNSIKKNSPEAKLAAASEAADQAAEAADRAKESYEGLTSALDDLANKQTALENMTRGTDEWNKALQESNTAVLDLIEKYPELASLVENVDGQLKLDTASDEVRDVMKKYEEKSIVARGESISAQKNVNEAKQAVNFSELEAIQKVSNQRGWQASAGWLGGATGTGAAVGAGSLAFLGPIGMAVGGVLGGAAGLLTGIIGSSIAGPIKAAGAKTDEELQKATENLAKSVEEGETELEFGAMQEFLIEQGVAADEARLMAQTFAEDTEALREYGKGVLAAEAANEAYYQAMATNAQQLLDIGKYDKDQIAQMNNAVDSDRMKAIEDARKEELKKEAKGSDSKEFKQAKEDYAKATYGDDATVDGNKIIYYDETGAKQEREMDEDAWVNAIAAADATKKAAEAMKQVPKAMEVMLNKLSGVGADRGSNWEIVEKALTNSNKLTKSELDTFSSIVGAENGKLEAKFDDKGNRIEGGNDAALYELWTSDDTGTLEAVYGDYKSFLEEYQDVIDAQNKAWKNITEEAKELNLVDENGEVKGAMANMSAEAAKTWTNLLGDIMPGGGDAEKVDLALQEFLVGKSQEEVDSIMAQIGAIDTTNSMAWENLAYTFEQMGIVTDSTDASLQAFIEEAKIASHAIAKIDFSNFNSQVNDTIKLLNKIKEGQRTYSEDDYKSIIAANKGLESDFVQVGDEFIYLGTAMKDLTDAVQENTINKLQEANQLISSQKTMAGILSGDIAVSEGNEKIGTISTSSNIEDQRAWLMNTVRTFAKEGEDIAGLGVEGLNLDTKFSELSNEKITEMVGGVLEWSKKFGELSNQEATTMRSTNVAALTTNNAAYNALQGAEAGEWAEEYQDALQVQATQAGVGEVMIQSYRNAADAFNARMAEIAEGDLKGYETKDAAETAAKESFKQASQNLLNMMETVEENKEAQEQLDALSPLADKVAAAIEKQRQDTIDRLSDINDSVNTANDRMISKIQEQIDDARQERENQKAKDNLTDMYSQQAYLAMDTSGANALQMVDNEQAIKDAEQEYEDMMIDQAIQQLQDANEKAAEQRERQINLLQQQLDYELESGLIAEEAAQIVRESLNKIAEGDDITNTKLGEFMNNELNTLGGMEKESARNEWIDIIMTAIGEYNPDTDNKIESDPDPDKPNVTPNELVLGGNGGGGGEPLDTDNVDEEQLQTNRNNAIAAAKTALTSADAGGLGNKANNQAFKDAYTAYSEAGGELTEDAFGQEALGITSADQISGTFPSGVTVKGINPGMFGIKTGYDDITVQINEKTIGEGDKLSYKRDDTVSESDKITDLSGGSPEDGWLAMYKGEPYIYYNGGWRPFDNNSTNGRGAAKKALRDEMQKYLVGKTFKTGGLADFTGPAWLDGTKSRPEYVLNSAQTEKFFALIDVLEKYNTDDTKKTTGDNYFDIAINVEKLDSDYDLEQIANKIRGMIYEDATYRNVNAINRR